MFHNHPVFQYFQKGSTLFFALSVILLGCQPKPPDNGTQTLYYWKGGPVRSIRNYQNGKLHGVSKIFYKDGKVKEKITYVNGLPDGVYEKYAQDGDVFLKATFKKGEAVEKQNTYLKETIKKSFER